MAKYKLADLLLQVDGAGEATENEMKKYRCETERRADIFVTVTPEMKRRERALHGDGFSEEYLESIAVYRAFCEQALRYDVMFFHASAIVKDGEAFLFSGPSGAGKSSHTQMWKKAFGDHVIIINDDKPLIRFRRDGAYVYGTPWSGKAHLDEDLCVRISGIGMIRKSDTNSVRRLSWQEAEKKVSTQLFRPESWEHQQTNRQLGNRLINLVPCYDLACYAVPEAAVMAWETMRGK